MTCHEGDEMSTPHYKQLQNQVLDRLKHLQ